MRAHLNFNCGFLISLFIALNISSTSHAQKRSRYGARVCDASHYAGLKEDLKLVRVDSVVPGIFLDIRYASACNFMGKPMYNRKAAYLVKPAAEAIRMVEDSLRKLGLGLVFYDGYRPYSVTVEFWNAATDRRYVADPRQGSRHNRGCAVDVGLVRYCDKTLLEMPTPYDDFTRKAHAFSRRATDEAIANRKLLQSLMTRFGFRIFPTEWWHFDFRGWHRYPLLDVGFEEL
jgi:D-alanyl-D-alanine dipeptidase